MHDGIMGLESDVSLLAVDDSRSTREMIECLRNSSSALSG